MKNQDQASATAQGATADEKLARCRQVANELARLNPALVFRYNDGSVTMEHDGRMTLLYSWTLFGTFVETHRLDVTDYVGSTQIAHAA